MLGKTKNVPWTCEDAAIVIFNVRLMHQRHLKLRGVIALDRELRAKRHPGIIELLQKPASMTDFIATVDIFQAIIVSCSGIHSCNPSSTFYPLLNAYISPINSDLLPWCDLESMLLSSPLFLVYFNIQWRDVGRIIYIVPFSSSKLIEFVGSPPLY